MKKINLVLQSKGGVGKSLFMWFVAQAEKEDTTAFIDLDESTQTSFARLGSIVGEERVRHFAILDENKKLEREEIMNLFEKISKTKTDRWFIDFGAPESEEFRKLLEYNISAEELATDLQEMGVELCVFVVLAGKDALVSCLNYYNSLQKIIDGKIPVLALMNEGTFGGLESMEYGHKYLNEAKIPFKAFGRFGDSESGRDIIKLITEQKDPSSLNWAGRNNYKKAIQSIKNIID